MSLDYLYQEMKMFRDALVDFNILLKAHMQDLQSNHDRVSPLWQDEMRREYDAQLLPLQDMMSHYIKVESRGYVEFLSMKIHELEMVLSKWE